MNFQDIIISLLVLSNVQKNRKLFEYKNDQTPLNNNICTNIWTNFPNC